MTAMPPPIPRARRGSHTGCRLAIALLSLALLASLAVRSGRLRDALPFERGARPAAEPEDQFPRFSETHSYGLGQVKAVRIPVQGVITRSTDGGLFGLSADMAQTVLQQIRAAQNDESVRAILLEVDSPGGAITPVDEIAAALRAFRASRNDRRIVAFVRDLAASGGYYILAGSDRVVAEPTALVGSISVLLQTLNWHELSERIGITDTTIKSGRNKDLLNPFHPVPEEQRAMLQRVVDDLHGRFLAVVREGRGLDGDALETLADGSVFTAAEAQVRGLVDELGGWEQAVRSLAEILDVPDLHVVRYQRRHRFRDLFAQVRHPLRLPVAWNPDGPRVWALWVP